MINAVFDQHEIAADQMKDTEEDLTAWTKAIKELSELVHECDKENSIIGLSIKCLVAHIFIFLLFEQKISEASYRNYAEVLSSYIQSLKTEADIVIHLTQFVGNANILQLLLAEI